MKKNKIHSIDHKHLRLLRANILSFLDESKIYDKKNTKLLDVGPSPQVVFTDYFKSTTIHTLDINPQMNPTYIADICNNNSALINDYEYDYIFLLEVLEHVNNPFKAIEESRRILKNNGYLFISTPFNFRIHGPLPDNWRFTEHGLRLLLRDFSSVSLKTLESERWLMPIHYTARCQK